MPRARPSERIPVGTYMRDAVGDDVYRLRRRNDVTGRYCDERRARSSRAMIVEVDTSGSVESAACVPVEAGTGVVTERRRWLSRFSGRWKREFVISSNTSPSAQGSAHPGTPPGI